MKSSEKRHNNVTISKLLIFLVLLCNNITCVLSSGPEEELEVILEFNEYDLEDNCIRKTDAEFLYYSSYLNWTKVREIEEQNGEYERRQATALGEHANKTFSNKKVQRLLEIFLHPGISLLSKNNFTKVLDLKYEIKNFKSNKHKLNCQAASTNMCEQMNRKDMEERLLTERSQMMLNNLYTDWYRLLENTTTTKETFTDHLRNLEIQAILNNAPSVADYWLSTSEISKVNYESALELWKQIMPLYQKLRRFVAVSIAKKYGRNILSNSLIPAHILGTLDAEAWLRTSEKFEIFYSSETHQQVEKSFKNLRSEDLYKLADEGTSALNLGALSSQFYKKSIFNSNSSTCLHMITDHCKTNHVVKVLSCDDDKLNWEYLLKIHENVMRYKVLNLAGEEREQENGYLLREGSRDSVIYEAMANLAATLATQSSSLKLYNLLPATSKAPKDELITHQLVTALNLLPRLPYYLLADLWRINSVQELHKRDTMMSLIPSSTTMTTTTAESDWYADFNLWTTKASTASDYSGEVINLELVSDNHTEEVSVTPEPEIVLAPYNVDNVTREWWSLREKLVGVTTPESGVCQDYLMDDRIISNQPYISRFLGGILQFQILEFLQRDNLTSSTNKLQDLLKEGKSLPWETLLEQHLNISQINVEPLLNYFKPLEEFLDQGGRFDSLDGNKLSIQNNLQQLFKYVTTTKAPAVTEGAEVEPDTDSALTTIAVCIVLAACAVIFLVLIIRRKKTKKRLEKKKKQYKESAYA